MSVNPISFKQLPYDPARDFIAVAMVCNLGPQMLSVNAELPVKTVPEFFAYAKANRGKLSIAFDNTAGAAAVRRQAAQPARRPRPRRGALSRGRADDPGRGERRQCRC